MLYRSGPSTHSSGSDMREVPEGTLIDVDLSHVWLNQFYNYECVSFDEHNRSKDPKGYCVPWVRFYRERCFDYLEFFNAL